MRYSIQTPSEGNASILKDLLDGYYDGAWNGTVERLEQNLLEFASEMLTAETPGGDGVGFIAFTQTFDLNWCLTGGEVIDFYVSPHHRGRGAALLLLARTASKVRENGGHFLKGGTANPALLRTCRRFGMCEPDGTCYLSGRAFDHLANLSGKPLREAMGELPKPAWNSEPPTRT